jgi:Trk-type K+ transport system membrane component
MKVGYKMDINIVTIGLIIIGSNTMNPIFEDLLILINKATMANNNKLQQQVRGLLFLLLYPIWVLLYSTLIYYLIN